VLAPSGVGIVLELEIVVSLIKVPSQLSDKVYPLIPFVVSRAINMGG
jgi:hypothetical protein